MVNSLLHGILGHQQQISQMRGAIASGRLTQTWIFSGPSGVGKKRVALGLAQMLLCEQAVPLRPCGTCGACARVGALKSEGVLLIHSGESGSTSGPNSGQIKVEQARSILDFLSLRRLGRARVVIIDQAQQMNLQTANALLKILEEPPEETYFFLITSQVGALPATIRSRAQVLRFRALEMSELQQLTGGAAEEWLLQSAQGSAEIALQLVQNEASVRELRHQALDILYRGFREPQSVGSEDLKKLTEDRDGTLSVAGLWFRILRDARVVQRDKWFNRDWSMLVDATAKMPESDRVDLEDRLLSMEADVRGNVDRSLLFETFWAAWRKSAQASMGRVVGQMVKDRE